MSGTPLIDASAFPEIIAMVVSQAPVEGLPPPLRATCHTIRRLVDRRLARHIILKGNEAFKTAYGPLPPLWNWNEVISSVRVVDAVHVIDQNDNYDNEYENRQEALDVCGSLRNVEYAREHGDARSEGGLVHTRNSIHFLPMPQCDTITMTDPPAIGARRLVVNLCNCEARTKSETWHRLFNVDEECDIVIVFSMLDCPDAYQTALEYFSFVVFRWTTCHTGTVMIVDKDGIRPPGHLRADFLDYFPTHPHTTWPERGPYEEPTIEWVAENVTFLTFDEYRARVGDEAAALETDENAIA